MSGASRSSRQGRRTRIPYDPAADREKLRGQIAVALLALFAAIILTLLISTVAGWLSDDRIEKLAGVLISPVSGLLGAVIGFYYGEQAHARF
jgi:uncharacterized membrane protein YeaQ/YmgE (transglycosylase-associated protein family)